MIADRIAGVALAAFAVWYGLAAGAYTAGFSDPLGPSAFPRMVAVPMGVLSLYLIVKPDPDPTWPRGAALLGQAAAVATLVLFAMAIRPLGFPLSAFLAVTALARILGGDWRQSLVTAAGLAVGLYLLFEFALDLSLPLGTLWFGD